MKRLHRDKVVVQFILVISIIVPLIVLFLFYIPKNSQIQTPFNIRLLPFCNAVFNSGVAFFLLLGFFFVKIKNFFYHKICMLTALFLSILFLLSYVLYHFLEKHYGLPHTKFGGIGFIKYFYYFILFSHIILATSIIPLALFSIYRAFNKQYKLHKKLVKWTLPIWLYVSISGVLVYILISPYYK